MFETLKNANTSKANAGRINYLNFYFPLLLFEYIIIIFILKCPYVLKNKYLINIKLSVLSF